MCCSTPNDKGYISKNTPKIATLNTPQLSLTRIVSPNKYPEPTSIEVQRAAEAAFSAVKPVKPTGKAPTVRKSLDIDIKIYMPHHNDQAASSLLVMHLQNGGVTQ